MNLHLAVIGLSSMVAFGPAMHGAELSTYRNFRLGMPLADVAKQAGIPESGAKLISRRPEWIEELDWQIGWSRPGPEKLANPFREVVFRFYNNALYQMSISYDRERTQGMTDADMVEAIASVYGTAAPTASLMKDSNKIAQWEDEQSQLSLIHLPYYAGFGLIVSLKRSLPMAEQAILESARLDAIEAPQREAARLAKQQTDNQLVNEKARAINKAGFRP